MGETQDADGERVREQAAEEDHGREKTVDTDGEEEREEWKGWGRGTTGRWKRGKGK